MILKHNISNISVVLLCILALSGCGGQKNNEKIQSSVEVRNAVLEAYEHPEASVKENRMQGGAASGTLHKMPQEENGLLELYAGGDVLSLSVNRGKAPISPQELLTGNLILYDRFRTDGWIFEWLISDYDASDSDRLFLEECVLLISKEDGTEDTQVIHVEAEGEYGVWVSVEHKFEYVDVNFDGIPDLLICTGHHGNQGLLTYYCFLQTENGFAEAPTFTEIANPAIDAENQLVLSQWRNDAASHSWAEYRCQDDTYVLYRELCEDMDEDADADEVVWVWTVNGQEIGRSDELSGEEIDDLIYNENSEWGIAGDRWRTLYNHGLTTDYSIYSTP